MQIQIDCTATGLTRLALRSKLSPLSVCRGFRNLSNWVSEYQRLTETKSRFRDTGNNSDKESLLVRGTDLPNENHSYVSWCCYSSIMKTTILLFWSLYVSIYSLPHATYLHMASLGVLTLRRFKAALINILYHQWINEYLYERSHS